MVEESYHVTLNVYDLSQGLARQLSSSFLGKTIEGVWHTGVVVYGNEYYFGGGIQQCPAGSTPYGTPVRVVELGVTYIPQEVFEGYLEEISPRYTAETYSLLTHNCNNFSNEVAQFLVDVSIPDYILQLPNEVMSSPMGPLILPMLQQMEATLRSNAVPQVPRFRPSSHLSVEARRSSTNVTNASRTSADGAVQVKNAVEASATAYNDVVPSTTTSAEGPKDALGGARNKLQDEIAREFAAIMASGTLRASEAAALATRRVMQRYGSAIAMQQS